MNISAQQISDLVDGTIEGDPDIMIHGPSQIENGQKGTISFLGNMKYESYVYTTEASVLLVSKTFEPTKDIEATLIRVHDVYGAIGTLLGMFQNKSTDQFKHSEYALIDSQSSVGENTHIGHFTVIEKNAKIGENSWISDQVFVAENVEIGKNCKIYPGVKIYANSIIGDNCIIHSGAIIGSDGFGYSKNDAGEYTKINHIGNVVIENNVEIGANTVIDRGTMGPTTIKQGVKLDNLIQIAHNVTIGKNTVMAAQAGIAGSAKIGERVEIGGQAGIIGHRVVADEVQIQAQTGVMSNIKEVGKRLYGYPALEYYTYLKAYALFKNLPSLEERVKDLEKKLSILQNKTKSE